MTIIIYILAAIGGLCVIGMAGLMILLIVASSDCENESRDVYTCAITGEHCIYTAEREMCAGCPIAEEMED